MLVQLIWKDLRVCRLPLIAGVALIVGSFVLTYLAVFEAEGGSSAIHWRIVWEMRIRFASLVVSILAQLALAMVAGSLIASERTDGTCRFLESLPISKSKIWGSKAIVLAAFVVAITLLAWGGLALFRLVGNQPFDFEAERDASPIFAFGVAAVGVGWCASSIFESPAFSVSMGIVAPLVALVVVAIGWEQIGADWSPQQWYRFTCIGYCGAGAIAFVVGSVYFLRRPDY